MSVRNSIHDVRPAHIALNVVSNCHSSACVEVGNTRVICAVRHPQQLVHEYRGDRGRVSCEVHRVATVGKESDTTVDLDLSLALEGVAEQLVMLENAPQLLMDVTLEVIRDEGALWDALSTALSCALAVGGIDMIDMFSASTAALLDDGSVVVDVLPHEVPRAKVIVVVCTSLHTNQIAYMKHQGGQAKLSNVPAVGRTAARRIVSRSLEKQRIPRGVAALCSRGRRERSCKKLSEFKTYSCINGCRANNFDQKYVIRFTETCCFTGLPPSQKCASSAKNTGRKRSFRGSDNR